MMTALPLVLTPLPAPLTQTSHVCMSPRRHGKPGETEARTSLSVPKASETERRPGSKRSDELGGIEEEAEPGGAERETC